MPEDDPGVVQAGQFMRGLADVPPGTLLDEQALATSLHLSPRTVRRLVGRGQLPPGVKLGGRRIWVAGRVIDFVMAEADRLAAATRRVAIRRGEVGV
jgi:hypothetical protein